MKSYKDLDVYRRAYELAIQIHKLSMRFPREMQFDIADQLRRASRSIPSNIAEGYGRGKSEKDILNFVRTALGSNDEVLFNLNFLKDIDLITDAEHNALRIEYTICGKQLSKLAAHLNQQQAN